VKIEHPELMQKLGDGLYAAPSSDVGEVSEVRVRQGYLEQPNATAAENSCLRNISKW